MIVAKKKDPESKPAPGNRVSILGLKGSPEYKAYLEYLTEESRIPLATIVRDAIADWAAGRDLKPPPAGEGRARAGRRS